MKTKLPYQIKKILSAFYILALIVTILSVIRNGFAYTGGGMLIPDSWIFYSFAIFLVLTAIQAILFHTVKDKYCTYGLWLALIKCAAVFIVELVVDYYVFNYSYIASNIASGFDATVWHTVLVTIFLGLILTIGTIEIIGWASLRKNTATES